MKSQPTNL